MTGDVSLLTHYFPELSDIQVERLEQYGLLLKEWNKRINLVSRKDIEYVFAHHILYSLVPEKVIPFAKGSKVLDVGTGGGLPGIPLAIVLSGVHFHLIDRTGKKISAVNDMIRALALKNVTAEQVPAEAHRKKYHFIVGRGITRFLDFVKMVNHNLIMPSSENEHNGIIYLTGGITGSEMTASGCTVTITPVSRYYSDPYFKTKKIIYCRAGKWIKAK